MENRQNDKPNFTNDGSEERISASIDSSDNNQDRHETEHDLNSLESEEFGISEGTLNVDDPGELAYWAEQFQISTDELKSAALLQGNSIRQIKKYLSV